MTNEQTALMLKLIARQLIDLAREIEPLIESGEREKMKIWVGEGERPLFPMTGKNWEMQPIGELIAVRRVLDFADTLAFDAESLLTTAEVK